MEVELCKLWYNISNMGDGAVGVGWYLTEEAAQESEDNEPEPFSESTVGSIDSYVGSEQWKEAKTAMEEVWSDEDHGATADWGEDEE